MPKLSDSFPTTQLRLNVSRATVQATYVFSLADDESHRKEQDQDARGRLMITHMLRSWDLTDDAGVALPITTETVAMIPELDCQQLIGWLVKRINAEKSRAASGQQPKPQEPAPEAPAPQSDVIPEETRPAEESQPSETVNPE